MTDRSSERYTRGISTVERVLGPEGVRSVETIAALSPDLAGFVIEFAYCDVYAREGLASRERQLITLAAIVAVGSEAQVAQHVGAALRVGIPVAGVLDTLIQLVPYLGFPRVMAALAVARKVFEQHQS